MKLSATVYNRVYIVRAMPSPKFLTTLGTSDILKSLDEILLGVCKRGEKI